ncbi:hypothetical protein SDC9_129786 [bioreactor metagenome]|uniref:Uncharacterized protein n=1 Tax=bioreactor metagenome TaxID=1076179 RepID=A0A645D0I3_9ZZZZ
MVRKQVIGKKYEGAPVRGDFKGHRAAAPYPYPASGEAFHGEGACPSNGTGALLLAGFPVTAGGLQGVGCAERGNRCLQPPDAEISSAPRTAKLSQRKPHTAEPS